MSGALGNVRRYNSEMKEWLSSSHGSRRQELFAKVFEQLKELNLPLNTLQKCMKQLTQSTSVKIDKHDCSQIQNSPVPTKKRRRRIRVLADSDSDNDDSSICRSVEPETKAQCAVKEQGVQNGTSSECKQINHDLQSSCEVLVEAKTPVVITVDNSELENEETRIQRKMLLRKLKFMEFFDFDSDEETDRKQLTKNHLCSRGRTILEKSSSIGVKVGKPTQMCSLCEKTPWNFNCVHPFKEEKTLEVPNSLPPTCVSVSDQSNTSQRSVIQVIKIEDDYDVDVHCQKFMDENETFVSSQSYKVPCTLNESEKKIKCDISNDNIHSQILNLQEYADKSSSPNAELVKDPIVIVDPPGEYSSKSSCKGKILNDLTPTNPNILDEGCVLLDVSPSLSVVNDKAISSCESIVQDDSNSTLSAILDQVSTTERIECLTQTECTESSVSGDAVRQFSGNAENQQVSIVSSSGLPPSPQDNTHTTPNPTCQIRVKDRKTLGIPENWNGTRNVHDENVCDLDVDLKKAVDHVISSVHLCLEELFEKRNKIGEAQKELDLDVRAMTINCLKQQEMVVFNFLGNNVCKHIYYLQRRIGDEAKMFKLLLHKSMNRPSQKSHSFSLQKHENTLRFCIAYSKYCVEKERERSRMLHSSTTVSPTVELTRQFQNKHSVMQRESLSHLPPRPNVTIPMIDNLQQMPSQSSPLTRAGNSSAEQPLSSRHCFQSINQSPLQSHLRQILHEARTQRLEATSGELQQLQKQQPSTPENTNTCSELAQKRMQDSQAFQRQGFMQMNESHLSPSIPCNWTQEHAQRFQSQIPPSFQGQTFVPSQQSVQAAEQGNLLTKPTGENNVNHEIRHLQSQLQRNAESQQCISNWLANQTRKSTLTQQKDSLQTSASLVQQPLPSFQTGDHMKHVQIPNQQPPPHVSQLPVFQQTPQLIRQEQQHQQFHGETQNYKKQCEKSQLENLHQAQLQHRQLLQQRNLSTLNSQNSNFQTQELHHPNLLQTQDTQVQQHRNIQRVGEPQVVEKPGQSNELCQLDRIISNIPSKIPQKLQQNQNCENNLIQQEQHDGPRVVHCVSLRSLQPMNYPLHGKSQQEQEGQCLQPQKYYQPQQQQCQQPQKYYPPQQQQYLQQQKYYQQQQQQCPQPLKYYQSQQQVLCQQGGERQCVQQTQEILQRSQQRPLLQQQGHQQLPLQQQPLLQHQGQQQPLLQQQWQQQPPLLQQGQQRPPFQQQGQHRPPFQQQQPPFQQQEQQRPPLQQQGQQWPPLQQQEQQRPPLQQQEQQRPPLQPQGQQRPPLQPQGQQRPPLQQQDQQRPPLQQQDQQRPPLQPQGQQRPPLQQQDQQRPSLLQQGQQRPPLQQKEQLRPPLLQQRPLLPQQEQERQPQQPEQVRQRLQQLVQERQGLPQKQRQFLQVAEDRQRLQQQQSQQQQEQEQQRLQQQDKECRRLLQQEHEQQRLRKEQEHQHLQPQKKYGQQLQQQEQECQWPQQEVRNCRPLQQQAKDLCLQQQEQNCQRLLVNPSKIDLQQNTPQECHSNSVINNLLEGFPAATESQSPLKLNSSNTSNFLLKSLLGCEDTSLKNNVISEKEPNLSATISCIKGDQRLQFNVPLSCGLPSICDSDGSIENISNNRTSAMLQRPSAMVIKSSSSSLSQQSLQSDKSSLPPLPNKMNKSSPPLNTKPSLDESLQSGNSSSISGSLTSPVLATPQSSVPVSVVQHTNKVMSEKSIQNESEINELLQIKEVNRQILQECLKVRKVMDIDKDSADLCCQGFLQTSAMQEIPETGEKNNESPSMNQQGEIEPQDLWEIQEHEEQEVRERWQLEKEHQEKILGPEYIDLKQLEKLTETLDLISSVENTAIDEIVNQGNDGIIETIPPQNKNDMGMRKVSCCGEREEIDSDKKLEPINRVVPKNEVRKSGQNREVMLHTAIRERSVSLDSGYKTPSPFLEEVSRQNKMPDVQRCEPLFCETRRDVICAVCQKKAVVVCSVCTATCYCSKECQFIHWEERHYKECVSFESYKQDKILNCDDSENVLHISIIKN